MIRGIKKLDRPTSDWLVSNRTRIMKKKDVYNIIQPYIRSGLQLANFFICKRAMFPRKFCFEEVRQGKYFFLY